jgi:hypothetical protein
MMVVILSYGMTTIYIYGLTDPRTGEVRYIGKSKDLKRRLRHHLFMARTGREDTYKARWIRKLLDQGIKPDIVILVTTDAEHWEEDERRLIAEGSNLTNTSAGGEGVNAPRTEQWCARIGDAHRGKEVSEETRRKLREINLAKHADGCKNGHPWTEENTGIRYKNGQTYRACRACLNERSKARYRKKHGGLKGRSKFRKTRDKQEVCKRGHLMVGDNLRICHRSDGIEERICRECVRIRNREAKKATLKRALNRSEPPKHKSDTHCKNGHEYNEANTGFTKHGYHYCKECQRNFDRRRRSKR